MHHFVTYRYRKDLEAYLQANFGFSYVDLCGTMTNTTCSLSI